VAEQPDERSTLARLWSLVGSVVAPASLVTAMLFYFGYVSTRAQLEYFGVDVDALGFTTQEFVMRSPRPLLVPVLIALLAAAGLTWADDALRRRLRDASPSATRRWVRVLLTTGGVLLLVGLVLLLAFPALGDWPPYPLLTPALLALGAAVVARAAGQVTGPARPRPATLVALVAIVVVALFWATATVAQWSGTGEAKALARELTRLPAVVVDTADPLFAGDPAVVESVLEPAAVDAEQQPAYRYRYRGLRLLVEGDGRLFLVPERWSPSGSTFVVGLDDARVKFRFVDDPP
jgi:hypothetical protein